MREIERVAELFCAALLVFGLAACGSSASAPAAPSATPGPRATPTAYFPTAPPAQQFHAALVTDTGGLHDGSYNQLAWAALQQLHMKRGILIESRESGSPAAYLPALVNLSQHYASIIIAVGYSMSRAVWVAAHEFPRQRFAMVDARPIDNFGHQVNLYNVENLFFKEQDAGFLVGALAGLMEKNRIGKATHDTIAYLGGQPIPLVNHYLAGYVAGAKHVLPTIQILGAYAGSFTSPALGRSIALRQISEHADIFFQAASRTGAAYLQTAEQHGLYGVGVDSDQRYLGANTISSAVKRVDHAVRATVIAAMAGRFRGGDHVFGGASIGFAPPAPVVPASIVSQLRGYQREIAQGSIVPPLEVPAR